MGSEMIDEPSRQWWEGLDPGVRQQIDDLVLHDDRKAAVSAMLFPSQNSRPPSLGILEELVTWRYQELAEGIEYHADQPDLVELMHRLETLGQSPVAVEAVWRRRDDRWLVMLYAILERPGDRHPRFDDVFLGSYRRSRGTGDRSAGDSGPSWPQAEAAATDGRLLADMSGVAFSFTDPGSPRPGAPRWWGTADQ